MEASSPTPEDAPEQGLFDVLDTVVTVAEVLPELASPQAPTEAIELRLASPPERLQVLARQSETDTLEWVFELAARKALSVEQAHRNNLAIGRGTEEASKRGIAKWQAVQKRIEALKSEILKTISAPPRREVVA